MRLTAVGCSGSFAGPDSPASCYLVEAEDADGRTWRVLLDLGSGALGALQRVADPRSLDAVLLSHLHPDHFIDLCGLYVMLRYHPDGPPRGRLPVHGPADTAARIRDAYGAEPGEGPDGVYGVRPWRGDEQVRIGPLTVLPRRVDHPVEAYGLRLEHTDPAGRTASLVYSGDTDSCPALVDLARGADLLLAESAFQEGRDVARGIHMTGRRAGQVAREAGVRRLLLTHLPVWNDPATVLAEARGAFDGDVRVVEPLGVYEV